MLPSQWNLTWRLATEGEDIAATAAAAAAAAAAARGKDRAAREGHNCLSPSCPPTQPSTHPSVRSSLRKSACLPACRPAGPVGSFACANTMLARWRPRWNCSKLSRVHSTGKTLPSPPSLPPAAAAAPGSSASPSVTPTPVHPSVCLSVRLSVPPSVLLSRRSVSCPSLRFPAGWKLGKIPSVATADAYGKWHAHGRSRNEKR